MSLKNLIKKWIDCDKCNEQSTNNRNMYSIDIDDTNPHIDKGKSLRELIGKPCTYLSSLTGQHSEPFSSIYIPIVESEFGVWCIYSYLDGLNGPSTYLTFVGDGNGCGDTKYTDMSEFIEETKLLSKCTGLNFSYNKFDKYDTELQRIMSFLKKLDIVGKSIDDLNKLNNDNFVLLNDNIITKENMNDNMELIKNYIKKCIDHINTMVSCNRDVQFFGLNHHNGVIIFDNLYINDNGKMEFRYLKSYNSETMEIDMPKLKEFIDKGMIFCKDNPFLYEGGFEC